MLIHNKTIAILLLISGLMVAVSNAFLFVTEHTAWQAFMFLVGIGWIWIAATNLRRLQKTDSK